MKVLNLTNLEKSDIKYEIFKFPDGQQQVKILKTGWIPNISEEVTIKARLNNFKDLELIICATKSLKNCIVKGIHLYTPYFLGSRSDRKFEESSNNYLKDIICPIINSLNFESVTVMDPHSDVLEACLNNFKKVDNKDLILYYLSERYGNPKFKESYIGQDIGDFILISPDAGANKKIFKIAEQIGYTGDISTCSKSRDKNGKLSHVVVPLSFNHVGKDFIIIDDICDGGATFINIAKELKAQKCKGKIYLIITHGIFSKGLKELNEYFDGIYCTNSYVDMEDDNFSLINDKHLHKLKQLNVF